jgi:hypothetical protein
MIYGRYTMSTTRTQPCYDLRLGGVIDLLLFVRAFYFGILVVSYWDKLDVYTFCVDIGWGALGGIVDT